MITLKNENVSQSSLNLDLSDSNFYYFFANKCKILISIIIDK